MNAAQLALLWVAYMVVLSPVWIRNHRAFVAAQFFFVWLCSIGVLFYWGPLLWAKYGG